MAESERPGPHALGAQQHNFDVGPGYVDLKPIGHGASGVVVSARVASADPEQQRVAIKRISFQDQRGCRQALREIRIMRQLRHENVVRVLEVLDASGVVLTTNSCVNLNTLKCIYVVQELVDVDLYRVIRSKQLGAGHIKLFMYQLLCGLKYIHSCNVLHRDLKPSNILIDCQNLVLKISDFGVARVLDPGYSHKGHLTARVGTCWYRSPELILTPRDYTKAIDIWSAGCIFGEMLLGKVVFPGVHDLDQLLMILDTVELADDDWSQVLKVMPNKLLKNHPLEARTTLRHQLADYALDYEAVELLESMLTFDSKKRVSAAEALQHPYFSEYHDDEADEEPVARQSFGIEHEVDDLPSELLKQLICEESVRQANACGSRAERKTLKCPVNLPMSSSSSIEELRTLEEIFSMSPGGFVDDNDVNDSLVEGDIEATPVCRIVDDDDDSQNVLDVVHTDPDSAVLDDVARMNRRNAQNTERKSPCIFDVSGSRRALEQLHMSTDVRTRNGAEEAHVPGGRKKNDEDDEKDVAECSPRKMEEDLELSIMEEQLVDLFRNELVMHREEEIREKSETGGAPPMQPLHVQIEPMENYKEYCQPSPKSQSPAQAAAAAAAAAAALPATVRPGHGPSAWCTSGECNQCRYRTGRQVQPPAQSPLSKKNGATDGAEATFASNQDVSPAQRNKSADSNKDEWNRKQKLKAEEAAAVSISRKLILDKIETEKDKKVGASQSENELSNEEFDELYRLPTDHLHKEAPSQQHYRGPLKPRRIPRHDRRGARSVAPPHGHLPPRIQRHSNQYHNHRIFEEINEHLKGEGIYLEGACGGTEQSPENSEHSDPEDLHNISLSLEQPDLQQYALQNCATRDNRALLAQTAMVGGGGGGSSAAGGISGDQPLTSLPRPGGHGIHSTGDPLSSPESPPSPSTIRSGARPKKSPKKQKAL